MCGRYTDRQITRASKKKRREGVAIAGCDRKNAYEYHCMSPPTPNHTAEHAVVSVRTNTHAGVGLEFRVAKQIGNLLGRQTRFSCMLAHTTCCCVPIISKNFV